MSCMSLTKTHYQYIADSLYQAGVKFRGYAPFHATRVKFGEQNAAWEVERAIVMFVRKLQGWNEVAYLERYPHTEKESSEVPDWVTECKPTGAPFDACQLLKALQCADYQCIDADDYEESPEKVLLELIERDCREYLIEESEGYKAAKWGIE